MAKKSFIFTVVFFLVFAINGQAELRRTKPRKQNKSFWDRISARPPQKKQPTIVAGVRGVDEPEGIGDSTSRDWRSVELIEKFTLSEEELGRFVIEGSLK